MLKKRFRDAQPDLEELLKLGIIKEIENDFICIKFLDEQFDMLSEKRQKRIEAGRLGGLRKSSNAKAKLKQSSSYKDKDKDKDKDKNTHTYKRASEAYHPIQEEYPETIEESFKPTMVMGKREKSTPIKERSIEYREHTEPGFSRLNECPLPEELNTPEFVEMYTKYCDYMQESQNRVPISVASEIDFHKLLEIKKEHGDDPVQVIIQTIQGRNKSFFPLRDNKNSNTRKNASNNHKTRGDHYAEFVRD